MIIYKVSLDEIQWDKLCELYERVGLLKRFINNNEYEKIKIAFESSYKVVTAWDKEKLVGAGRMISDGVCYGAIFDVGVLPEYQKKGIGRGVMNELLKGNDNIPIHLTSTFGNEEFYKKLSFKKHKTAYSRYPFKTDYVED
ncbi:GNAT family N-acetyltransferase [Clostridium ihumii]|uniref:GNAT family N-acetyltransferase n=1 Tax=Clostridium ihumii TaxID=1470356 RepID=UPI0005538F3C|nr:GNAT family N-acetyltransferase [Clostridium ihumii]